MEVNIPRRITDEYYRYKMPVFNIKIEGKGNGIRTNIINICDIMKALNRPIDHFGKMLEFEIGTQSKINQNGLIVRGKHNAEQLAIILDKYIEIYVLCSKCNNPETILHIKPDKIISKCKACGHVFKITNNCKLTNYILKTEVPKKQVSIKNDNVKITNTNEEWSLDLSQSAIDARKQALSFEISNSMQIKRTFFNLFSDDIRTDFYKKIEQIRPYINDDKDMLLILRCIENLI
jgi:translation initiation factor 5